MGGLLAFLRFVLSPCWATGRLCSAKNERLAAKVTMRPTVPLCPLSTLPQRREWFLLSCRAGLRLGIVMTRFSPTAACSTDLRLVGGKRLLGCVANVPSTLTNPIRVSRASLGEPCPPPAAHTFELQLIFGRARLSGRIICEPNDMNCVPPTLGA